jgi:hypothetical protein
MRASSDFAKTKPSESCEDELQAKISQLEEEKNALLDYIEESCGQR